MTHFNPIQNIYALFHRPDRIAIEICRALFEFGKIFYRSQTTLRAMDLLIEHAAKAHGVQSKSSVLRTIIGIKMKLRRRMAIDVAIETRHAKTRLRCFAVVGGVEFFLRKRGYQQAQTIELDRS